MNNKEIKALGKNRAKEIKGDKLLIKDAYKDFKLKIKAASSKEEKKKVKKERKYFKKELTKKRRYTTRTILGLSIGAILINFGPMIKNILHALGGSDITMDSSTPEGQKALAYGDEISYEIAREGIVLLKNENNSLPLNNRKVNVFGVSAHEMRFGGAGSGNSDQSRKVDFFDSLKEKGIEYNDELANYYREHASIDDGSGGMFTIIKTMVLGQKEKDFDGSAIPGDLLDNAKAYSNKAIIMLSSSGVEASDMTIEQLQISENKMKLIDLVTKNFDDVTIIINAGNTLELGFIEDYPQIKSVLWVGTPGPYGALALSDVLSGNTNPSGRLVDTYLYDNTLHPSYENFGDYKYDNLKRGFMNYQESIYVGYRYFETRYQDKDEYEKVVLYPFGYGLSYSQFDWEVVEKDFNSEEISLTIKVSNVSDIAGKEVVQVYFNPPYIKGGPEKSHTVLADFAKTNLLEPNATELVHLNFKVSDMASYDVSQEAYVLDEGLYEIRLASDVHQTVESLDYQVSEKVIFENNWHTNVPYENQFEDAKGDITYLSRNDFEASYPSSENLNYVAPDYLVDNIDIVKFKDNVKKVELNQAVTLKLNDLKGLDYDDPKWEEFLHQFTLEELIDFVTQGAYKTIGIERLGIEQKLFMDGPAGYSYVFGKYTAAAYPTEIVVASTWSKDLAYKLGEAAGTEAVAYGIDGWYAPAMNIHRSPFGGRNFEYFSEDPYLSGIMSKEITQGAQDAGVIVFIKHYAMNDQEVNARSGIVIWADEQAIREIYLKPFEITVKGADPKAVMSSFSYIGPRWAGSHEGLLNKVLREEWGFDGFVSTDAVFGHMSADRAVVSGNDLMLDIMSIHQNKKALEKAYKEHPDAIVEGLLNSVHNILFTLINF